METCCKGHSRPIGRRLSDLSAHLLARSDGNLSAHARKLEEAEYVLHEFLRGAPPQACLSADASGRAALNRYLDVYATWSSLALHASRYFWKLEPFAIQLVLLSTTLGPLLGAPISAFALRYIEKRTFDRCLSGCCASADAPPLLQLYGPFSIAPTAATAILAINGLLVGTAIIIAGSVSSRCSPTQPTNTSGSSVCGAKACSFPA